MVARGGLYFRQQPLELGDAVFPKEDGDVDVNRVVQTLYELRYSPTIFHFVEKDQPVVEGHAYELIGYLIVFRGATPPQITTHEHLCSM